MVVESIIESSADLVKKLVGIALLVLVIVSPLVIVRQLYAQTPITITHREACPRYGGTLVIGRTGDSSTLNPLLTTDDDPFMVANQIFNSLIESLCR